MNTSNTTDIFAGSFSSQDELLERLENKTQVFRNEKIKEVFSAIDRRDFVESDYKVEAYEDYPLPIREGQTISQPTTVAFMLELLDPQEGDHVLDIGSGSGYSTALLAAMVGKSGRVIGLEIHDELVEFATANLQKYDMEWAKIRKVDVGIPSIKETPFDRILISAALEEIPQEILDQLAEGGVLVTPVRGEETDALVKITKKEDGTFSQEKYPGFHFVPFIS